MVELNGNLVAVIVLCGVFSWLTYKRLMWRLGLALREKDEASSLGIELQEASAIIRELSGLIGNIIERMQQKENQLQLLLAEVKNELRSIDAANHLSYPKGTADMSCPSDGDRRIPVVKTAQNQNPENRIHQAAPH